MNVYKEYDVIVVGAGHAGCEAAAAAANMGSRVVLITMDMTKIASLSCNPAMGGIAKGQIVREIDALGGYTGLVTDRSAIQFRMLNRSKGPAMWSPRAQCDRNLFSYYWRLYIESIENIDLWQDVVSELVLEDDIVTGVITVTGKIFRGKAVILTNGTFNNGLMHIGKVKVKGGRVSEAASYGITEQLLKLGFKAGRMKTGTPARIDGRTVDFSRMIRQDGDNIIGKFSFLPHGYTPKDQKPCYITYTNEEVHYILRKGFGESPLFSGIIKGQGPRYCPSIEDKIVTFVEKSRHQLFLEPEGWETCEYYINGFSSSLPEEIQIEALRRVQGLENVKIFRPGYAIEYDYYPSRQLKNTLETKIIRNLYFAGQINGTTGYEEAAGQGIMAGINAHLKVNGEGEFILNRDEAYIGVLIDDLITKDIDEPYRMFTSRAEFRLLLRQDNADERLTRLSYDIGLAAKERMNILADKLKKIDKTEKFLRTFSVKPELINPLLQDKGTALINQKVKLEDILLRPQISIGDIYEEIQEFKEIVNDTDNKSTEILECVEVRLKYKGYIEREKLMAEKIKRLENIEINPDFDYDILKSISTEGREKLKMSKPTNIGQASRISGVSPSDISVLLIYLGR